MMQIENMGQTASADRRPLFHTGSIVPDPRVVEWRTSHGFISFMKMLWLLVHGASVLNKTRLLLDILTARPSDNKRVKNVQFRSGTLS